LISDIGLKIPSLDVNIEGLNHEWIDELRRMAPNSPDGQKRIEVISSPLVYRLRIGDERGATWVEDSLDVVWLCGVKPRRKGSPEDAYAQFPRLHERGEFLPSADDYRRDESEKVIGYFKKLSEELLVTLLEARLNPGTEICRDLDDWLPCRLIVTHGGGYEEIWCALGIRVSDGRINKPQLRDLLFGDLALLLPDAEFEVRADWPSGNVDWFESVRFGIRSSD
jgi:hypothetical protein